MDLQPAKEETIEIAVQLNADLVRKIDLMRKKSLAKSRSQFVKDAIEGWYQQEMNDRIANCH